jgi:hypothetical protein
MIAVTCVAGNVGLEPVLNNARRILELAGRQDVRWLHRRRYADGAEDILLEEAKQAIAATEGEIGARGRTRRLPIGSAESIGRRGLGLAGCRSGTALYQRAARILSGGHVERSPFNCRQDAEDCDRYRLSRHHRRAACVPCAHCPQISWYPHAYRSATTDDIIDIARSRVRPGR